MGIFTDLITGEKKESKTPEQEQDNATRSVSGFKSLADVRAAATTGAPAEPPKRGRGRAASPAVPQVNPADVERALAAAEKEKQKQEAIDLTMGTIARQLAEVPYEVWAFYAEQPAFKLQPDEAEKLAKSYHLLAKALAPDMTGPFAMAAMVVLLNISFVGQRLAEENKRKADEKKKEEEAKNANSRPN